MYFHALQWPRVCYNLILYPLYKLIMKNKKTLSAFALIFYGCSAYANIYAYQGVNGTIHLTNIPTRNDAYKLVMKTPIMPVSQARSHFNAQAKQMYQPMIQAAAKRYGVSPALVNAVITAESCYNAGAVSPVGADGLMQLIPATAERYGVNNPFNAKQNINGGTAYLAHLLHQFHGDKRLAVAAYNAGSQAVINAGNHIPPFAETQAYVPRVMAYYVNYRYRMG